MSINYVDPSTGNLTPIAGTPASALTGLQEQISKNGAKNLVDISKTISSNTPTVITNLTDKGFTVSNTTAYQYPASKTSLNLIENTKYIVDFDVTAINTGNTTARGSIREGTNNSIKYSITCTSIGHYTFEFTYQAGYYLSFFPYMGETTAGTGSLTVDNIMLRLASNPDGTYQPYAMTNQELTQMVESADIAISPTMPDADTTWYSIAVSTPKIYKRGNVIYLPISIKITNAQTGLANKKAISLNIPSELRPKYHDLSIILSNGEEIGTTSCSLNTSGVLIVYPGKTGTTYAIGQVIWVI